MHDSFSHAYAFLCVSYGLAVLHVNYRGSTGFGGAALQRCEKEREKGGVGVGGGSEAMRR